MNKIIFLDKDGTLLRNVPYNVDPARMCLSSGAGETLRLLEDRSYLIAVVSNQSGVARGFFSISDLIGVERRLRALLEAEGVSLAAFRYCPHHPEGSAAKYSVACLCRKPQPQMLLDVADELDADLTCSWMIGDTLDDIEAGRAAGVRTVLLDVGNETEWNIDRARLPHHIVSRLTEAASVIGAVDDVSLRTFERPTGL